MAQDIILNGIMLEDVPALKVPKDGGGYAKFDDTTDADATAADILSGKTAYVDGVKLTGTGSGGGGGGSSRTVIGTFTSTSSDKGKVKTITLNYSGNGYPIALDIFPSVGGNNPNEALYNRVQRYGVVMFHAVKKTMTGTDATPDYQTIAEKNKVVYLTRYKSNATTATTYGQTGGDGHYIYSSNSPYSTSSYNIVIINSKTQMKVFIADESYGFLDGVEYTYIVTYSS